MFRLEDEKSTIAPIIYRHIECAEGWHDLIDTLCASIQGYINHSGNVEQPRVKQIKEKFGTLRFYISGYDDYIRGLIGMAEQISAQICEECGEKGVLQKMNWIKTLCHDCYHDYENIKQNRWDTWKNVKTTRKKQDDDQEE